MRQLRWAPQSRRDIRRIELWLDQIEPTLAGRIILEIEDKVEQLLDFPFLGSPFGRSSFRKLTIVRFDYIVIYRVAGSIVEIARVRHAREDWVAR